MDLDAFRDALRPLQHKYSKANNVTLGVNATVENSCCRLSARKLLTELFVAEIEVEAEWNSCLCRLVANPRARGCFREIDVDDDGKISSDDLDRFMRRQCGVPFGVEAARALLRCADRDQDGVIGLLDWVRHDLIVVILYALDDNAGDSYERPRRWIYSLLWNSLNEMDCTAR